MTLISRGFHGRRSESSEAERVPPGQYVTRLQMTGMASGA